MISPTLDEPRAISFFARGREAQPQSALGFAPGQVLGDFRLIKPLGQGGMGQVWEAAQVSLDRTVALKLVRPELVSEKTLAFFAREARAGGRLNHPNLVSVLGHGVDVGTAWIAMELIEGAWTLRNFLDEAFRASELPDGYYRDVAFLVARIADGMHAAHEAGVIHRDLKPQNILVDSEDHPKVTDFGLAKLIDESALSVTGDFAGTYWYASPEQVAGRRMGLDHRTDVFSLGVVLYELLAHRRPFEGDTTQQVVEQILTVDPPDLRTLRSRTPRDLAVITAKCLEKSPARRFRTMADLAEDLRRYLRDETILARPSGRLVKLGVWAQRNPTKSVASAIAGVSFVAISGLLLANVQANAALGRSNTDLKAANASLEEQTRLAQEEAERAERAAASERQAAAAERRSRGQTSLKAAELAVTYGRWQEALRHYADAEADPEADHVALALGRLEAFEHLSRPADATRELDWLTKQPSLGNHRARVALLSAIEEMDRDLAAGLEAVNKLLADPEAEFLTGADRGLAQSLVAEDFDAAVSHLESTRLTYPRHLPTLSLLGPLLIFAGRADDALALTREYSMLYPDSLEPKLVATLARACTGDFDAARASLKVLSDETARGYRQLLEKGIAMLEVLEVNAAEMARGNALQLLRGYAQPDKGVRVLAPWSPFPAENPKVKLRSMSLMRQLTGMSNSFAQESLGEHRLAGEQGSLRLQLHPWVRRMYAFSSMKALLGMSMSFTNPMILDQQLTQKNVALPERFLWLGAVFSEASFEATWSMVQDDELSKYRGVTSNLPGVRRLTHLLRVPIGVILLHQNSVPDGTTRSQVEAQFAADLAGVLSLPDPSQEELLAYIFVVANLDRPDRWTYADRFLMLWRDLYGETLQWHLTRAELALARGGREEARAHYLSAKDTDSDHPWLLSLGDRMQD